LTGCKKEYGEKKPRWEKQIRKGQLGGEGGKEIDNVKGVKNPRITATTIQRARGRGKKFQGKWRKKTSNRGSKETQGILRGEKTEEKTGQGQGKTPKVVKNTREKKKIGRYCGRNVDR